MPQTHRKNSDLVRNSHLFSASWYAGQYPDVPLSGVDPLEHYLRVGALLGRDPHPLFSSAHYAAQLRGRGLAAANPLLHYLQEGWRLHLNPHPLFHLAWYLDKYPDIAAADIEPVGHYLAHGAFEDRQPHPAVPAAEIFRRHPELRQRRINPLVYYLEGRWTEDPCPEATRYLASLTAPARPGKAEASAAPLAADKPMATEPITTDIRALAFYLPQFHTIPENDEWWGHGFTEWTNVRRGVPQFRGHYQPHVPHPDLGYYDLGDPEVMEQQAALARAAGIEGFVFYYYWFDGRRLLEKPLDRLLATGRPDFPFCLCWANENWTRTWDGSDKEVLVGQHHSPESDARFIRDLLPAFRDGRYIRVDGRPLLLVYRPSILPDFAATAARWREICRAEGIGEIYVTGVRSFADMSTEALDLDALVQFPPLLAETPNLAGNPQLEVPASFRGFIFDYGKLVDISLGQLAEDRRLLPGICPSWDNTARRLERGTSWLHSSPEAYRRWLRRLVLEARANLPAGERFIFINAWNEWAEGCHLEPDERHGYAWINATRSALAPRPRGAAAQGDVLVVSHNASRNGAQIVLLSLLREWARREDAPSFRIVLLGDGPLRPEFAALGDTLALFEYPDEETRDQALRNFLTAPPRIVLSNTVVNGPWLAKLRTLGIPVVTYVHELQKSIERWAPGEIMAATLRNSDHFIAVSPPVRDNLVANHAVPPEHISLVHPFIPVRFRPSTPAARIRGELGFGPDNLVVVGCGTMDHRKGPDLFVATAAKICAELPTARFVWVGGPASSADEHVRLQKLVDATGHADRIKFIGERAAARDYVAAGNIFFLPSREDPYPLVALEAADAGLPIVCFADSGGMPDFVKNSAGRTVPFEDTNAAAAALLALLRAPDERANLGRAGRTKVRALHDAGTGSMRLAEVLRQLMKVADPAAEERPLVSVIVPNYNHAQFLPERLASIAGQTHRHLEIILLDDKSTDTSLDILHDFVAKEPRARLIANTVNSGSTFKQWRKGLAEAKGKYVWIAESDDSAHPELLATLVARLEANEKATLAACCPRMTDLEGKDLGTPKDWFSDIGGGRWESDFSSPGRREIADVMTRKNAILNASGVLFRNAPDLRDLVDDSMRLCADWLFWIRLLARGDFEYAARPLNYWRLASSNARTKPPGEIEWDEGSRVLREAAAILGPEGPGDERLLEQFGQRCDGWKKKHEKESAAVSGNGTQAPAAVFLQRDGWCPICEKEVTFTSKHAWLRDHYLCSGCGSIPRERALMHVIQTRYPNWRDLRIHESSPGHRGASIKLREQCRHYTATQYDPALGFGQTHPTLGYRSEDLEKQTFADEEFDLVITQDVMEHIFDAEAAFREIHRTLKPGGAHIFTTPLVNKDKPTQRRAERKPDGTVVHLFPPEYHGNPMSKEGSLVTWHWGRDITDRCASLPNAETEIHEGTDEHLGIEGKYIEVIGIERRA